MVAAKVFLLTIHIHVHNVYCRGARLRPWGPIRLIALTSHSTAATRPLLPAFPLLVQEDLLFSQIVQCGNDLRALELHLKKETLKLQLTQGEGDLLLAQLTTSLARVLFPKLPLKRLREGVELELVMTPTSRFQSAVGPRVEISTRLVLEYCHEERVKVTDLSVRPCACPHPDMALHPSHFYQDSHHHPEERTHLQRHPPFRHPSGINSRCNHSNDCFAGSHQCDICDAYDMVVRRRLSHETASPWVSEPISEPVPERDSTSYGPRYFRYSDSIHNCSGRCFHIECPHCPLIRAVQPSDKLSGLIAQLFMTFVCMNY